MIIKPIKEKGHVCQFEIWNGKTKLLSDCGKPAVCIAAGKKYLCKDDAIFSASIEPSEYRDANGKDVTAEEFFLSAGGTIKDGE